MLKSVIRNRRFSVAGGIVLAAISAQPALAADTTLNVSATVTSNCIVSTSPIAFGDVDVTTNSNADAAGGLSVTCTKDTPWSASADAGMGAGADLAVRKMTSGTDLLSYALFTDSNRTNVWGDGVEASATIDDIGTGSAQSKTIYGRVLSGQVAALAGNYADTVTVTLTY